FGREAGMPFPAGPKIEEIARKGRKYVGLPYSVKGMDVSFSGILTAAINSLKRESMEDVCFSMQETCFSMLTEVAERAMAHTEKEEVLLGGGVASNERLRNMVRKMAEERGAKFYCPPGELLVDNGAMIAWTAILMKKSGIEMDIDETAIKQNFRTDEVDVTWRH
ncbi:MAG: UGMP family protein, partial [Thermoplasmata archaeon]